MLYAQVKDKGMWPTKWERCDLMANHLNRITYGYQLNIERRMLYDAEHPEHRGVLVKWSPTQTMTRDMQREVLLETCDPEQMEAALFMLINEAEVAANAMKWVHQGQI
jgi:hypothetical protein